MTSTVGFLTAREVCQRWSISRATLARWRSEGWAPQPVRFAGRTVRWPLAEIVAFESSLATDRIRPGLARIGGAS